VEKTLKRKIFGLLDWKTAALPAVFFNRPFGLRPFCPLDSLRFSQVAQGDLPSPRLAIEQNDSPFFIPLFFRSLPSDRGGLHVNFPQSEGGNPARRSGGCPGLRQH